MFIIDRIEENIVVLENTNTKKIKEININKLPNGIKEGSILTFDGANYIINNDEETKRRKKLQDKFNRLKNKN